MRGQRPVSLARHPGLSDGQPDLRRQVANAVKQNAVVMSASLLISTSTASGSLKPVKYQSHCSDDRGIRCRRYVLLLVHKNQRGAAGLHLLHQGLTATRNSCRDISLITLSLRFLFLVRVGFCTSGAVGCG